MTDLKEIIQYLKHGEKLKLRNYYIGMKDKRVLKRIDLFEMIDKAKVSTEQEACLKLYGKPHSSAYSNLKKSLISDMINVIYLIREDQLVSYTLLDKHFIIRKLISVGELLAARGSKTGIHFLKQALSLSEKYEKTEEMLIILNLLASLEGYKFGLKKYNEYHFKIENCILLLKEIQQTNKYYNEVLISIFNTKNDEQRFILSFKKWIKTIERMQNFKSSSKIQFNYFHLKIWLNELELNLEEALKYAELLLKLVKNTHALNCKKNKSAAFLQYAEIHLKSKNYAEAEIYAKKAMPNVNPKGSNLLLSYDIIFISLFKQNKLNDLKNLLEKVKTHPVLLKNQIKSDQWKLYNAWYLYLCKNYKASINLLNNHSLLLKDNTGWQIMCKLLEIYNLAALNDFNELELRIHAYDQLIKRYTVKKINNKIEMKRMKIISQILNNFIKTNFDFNKTAIDCKVLLKKLSEPNKDNTHLALNTEVLLFDEWFLNHD